MKLTAAQKLAVTSVDRSTAIVAGAGSGKTQVLTGRLLQSLQTGRVELHQILCITFTEKAAQELKNRIAQQLPEALKKELPWAPIGTFHGFCLQVLRDQAPLLGLSEWFSVRDEHTAKLAIYQACRSTLLAGLETKDPNALFLTEAIEFRHTLELIEDLMSFRWHAEKHFKTADSEKKLFEATQALYQQALAAYTEEKRKHQVLDFQDLEMQTLALFKEHPEILKIYRKRFRHILVDEVQDINDLQFELITTLFVPGKNTLCIVGDPKQSIYRFRGANVEGFDRIVNLILQNRGHLIELKYNFRSRPSVLRFVNHTFKTLFDPRNDFALQPFREESQEEGVLLLPVPAASQEEKPGKEAARQKEAAWIAQWILAEAEEKKRPFGDFTLLFQSLSDTPLYEEAFKSNNIPYRLSGGRGFLGAQEVIDLLFCLKLATNIEDRLALAGLMRSPLVGLPDAKITELCLNHPADLGQAFLAQPEAAWFKPIHEKRDMLSAAEILEQAVAQTGYDGLLKALDPSDTKLGNVEQLIELIRQLETEENLSLKQLLDYFDALKKRQARLAQAGYVDAADGACQMMTVHAAKGLEFPVVILPDLIRGRPTNTLRTLFLREEGLGFSVKKNPDEVYSDYVPTPRLTALKEKNEAYEFQERKRLLYVALTRAEEKIVIPWHDGAVRTGLWYKWLSEALSDYAEIGRWTPPDTAFPERENEGLQRLRSLPVIPAGKKSAPAVPHYTVTQLKNEPDTFGAPSYSANPPDLLRGPAKPALAAPKGIRFGGTDLGNWVHAVLKEIKTQNLLPLETVAKTKLLELGLIANEADFRTGVDLIRRFLQSDIAPPNWQGLHELPFRLKIGDGVVTGIIDYALESESGWTVFDFKTDAKPDPEKYRLQMDIYALALSRANPKPVLETRLLFLQTAQAHAEACTPERLQKTEEELLRAIQSFKVAPE